MSYTVWVHGQQIGETQFEYRHTRRKKAGAFHPTEFGLKVLPGITAMAPALFDFGDLCRRSGIDSNDARPQTASAAFATFADTPEGQRVLAAAKQIADVEVRDSSGRTVTWESLAITDLEWLADYARKRKPLGLDRLATLPAHDPIKFMISLTLAEKQDGVTRVRLESGVEAGAIH